MAASGGTAAVEKHDGAAEQPPLAVPWAHALLIVGAALPLFVPVDTNVNVIATATLTVFIGCRRSVKPDPPEDSMSQKVWNTRRLHPLLCLGQRPKHSAIDNISVVLCMQYHLDASRMLKHSRVSKPCKAAFIPCLAPAGRDAVSAHRQRRPVQPLRAVQVAAKGGCAMQLA